MENNKSITIPKELSIEGNIKLELNYYYDMFSNAKIKDKIIRMYGFYFDIKDISEFEDCGCGRCKRSYPTFDIKGNFYRKEYNNYKDEYKYSATITPRDIHRCEGNGDKELIKYCQFPLLFKGRIDNCDKFIYDYYLDRKIVHSISKDKFESITNELSISIKSQLNKYD